MGRLKVTWKYSTIGLSDKHRRTIESLGLHRLNDSAVHDDSPTIRGMVYKVRHMVTLEIVDQPAAEGKAQ